MRFAPGYFGLRFMLRLRSSKASTGGCGGASGSSDATQQTVKQAVTEAMRGDEPYTDQRMEKLVTSNRSESIDTIARRLTEDIEAYVGDGPRSDDITMLLVRRK